MNEEHLHWMQVCLQLAREAMQSGNAPVGAIIVREGKIIGRGKEAGKSQGDITFHAEIEAIRDATKDTSEKKLSDCILYTTHEPCIMCSYVIRHHQIRQVVFGVESSQIGGYSSAYPILSVRDISIWATPPAIIQGIAKEECEQLSHQYRSQK